MSSPRAPRHPPATFQPRFTLSLFYFFGFFFVYCLALIAPALIEVARTLPPGPEQQKLAEEVTREALGRNRLWIAGLLAAVALVLTFGSYTDSSCIAMPTTRPITSTSVSYATTSGSQGEPG